MHLLGKLAFGFVTEIKLENNQALVSGKLRERLVKQYISDYNVLEWFRIIRNFNSHRHQPVKRNLLARDNFHGLRFGIDNNFLALSLDLRIIVVPIGTLQVSIDFLGNLDGCAVLQNIFLGHFRPSYILDFV